MFVWFVSVWPCDRLTSRVYPHPITAGICSIPPMNQNWIMCSKEIECKKQNEEDEEANFEKLSTSAVILEKQNFCQSIWEGYKVISKDFGVHHSTERKIIHKWKTLKTVANVPRSGRPSKFTSRSDRCNAQRNCKKPSIYVLDSTGLS